MKYAVSMSHDDKHLDDFLSDSYFKQWVLHPDAVTDNFWNNYLEKHVEKRAAANQARMILTLVDEDVQQQYPDGKQVEAMWKHIENQTQPRSSIFKGLSNIKALWKQFPTATMSTAAAMTLLLIGWLVWPSAHSDNYSYAAQTSSIQNKLVEKINQSQTDLLVILPDRSWITLKPNSRVSFPIAFQESDKREVYLTGEAFFRVTKNPARPFYVYAHELVTKVLGTSFTIKAFEGAKDMEVVVKTGKVSVFSRRNQSKSVLHASAPAEVAVVTPNQRIKYEREQKAMHKLLIENPELLPTAKPVAMVNTFHDVPVAQIFENIKEAYGIDIQYDPLLHGNCLLTASFGKETLFEKIDLICKGIEANYRIENAQIIVDGRGCH